MSKIKEHYFTLDWLSFTFSRKTLEAVGYGLHDVTKSKVHISQLFRVIFPEFDNILTEMVQLSHGRFGYDEAFSFNGEMMIMTKKDESYDFGVFVTIPSHGLYKLGEMFDLPLFNKDFYETQKLFQILLSRGAKITRLDFCYDDFNKYLTPDQWCDLFRNGYVDTKTLHHEYISSRTGGTFYLGKRGKGRMLRIYDKAGESHGEIDSIRYELECKNDYAYNLAVNIASGIKFNFVELLESFCKVKSEPINEINEDDSLSHMQKIWRKKCIPLLEEYEKLCDDIRNCSQNADCIAVLLPRVSNYYSAVKRRVWIRDYVAKALEKHVSVYGLQDLLDMIELARDKLTSEDFLEIKRCKGIFEIL